MTLASCTAERDQLHTAMRELDELRGAAQALAARMLGEAPGSSSIVARLGEA